MRSRAGGAHQLAADQITAEDEEKIDPDPAPAMNAAGDGKAHDAGVVNDHHDNGECAEKIETRLAFAICKTGIDSQWRYRFRHRSQGK